MNYTEKIKLAIKENVLLVIKTHDNRRWLETIINSLLKDEEFTRLGFSFRIFGISQVLKTGEYLAKTGEKLSIKTYKTPKEIADNLDRNAINLIVDLPRIGTSLDTIRLGHMFPIIILWDEKVDIPNIIRAYSVVINDDELFYSVDQVYNPEYITEELKRQNIKVLTPGEKPIGFDRDIKAIETLIEQKGKGVLMVGMPGTGKTMLAKYLANTRTVYSVNFSTYLDKYVGETERKVRKVLRYLRTLPKDSVVYIDEFEKLFATDDTIGSHVHKNTLKEVLHFLEEEERPYVLASANGVTGIPTELLRPGRWDYIIPVFPPNKNQLDIFITFYAKKYNLSSNDIPSILWEKDTTPADINQMLYLVSKLGKELAEEKFLPTRQLPGWRENKERLQEIFYVKY